MKGLGLHDDSGLRCRLPLPAGKNQADAHAFALELQPAWQLGVGVAGIADQPALLHQAAIVRITGRPARGSMAAHPPGQVGQWQRPTQHGFGEGFHVGSVLFAAIGFQRYALCIATQAGYGGTDGRFDIELVTSLPDGRWFRKARRAGWPQALAWCC